MPSRRPPASGEGDAFDPCGATDGSRREEAGVARAASNQRRPPWGTRLHAAPKGPAMHDHSPLSKLPAPNPPNEKERGKVGLAALLWLLGVPGSIVLLYLVFAR